MKCPKCGSKKVRRLLGCRASVFYLSDGEGKNFEFDEVSTDFDEEDIIAGTAYDECADCGEELD